MATGEAAAVAADPLALQRHSAAAGAASSNDTDAIQGQPALADRLQSLQINDGDVPDRTQPHPAPVASTSSSSSPHRSDPVELDLAAAEPPTAPAIEEPHPTKRKLVLLKRPATPTDRTNEDRDRRSDEPTTISDPSHSQERDETSGSATTPASPYGAASPGNLAEADSAAAPALDPVLHGALNHPRDRFLLLRAEVELERFILNQTMTRLPLAPPHFQPGLNSYQRLLIHRLADMFGITREVEPAPPTMWNAGMINPATGQPQGVVVLVKSETASIPNKKLASYVPAPDSTPSVASPAPHLSVARTSSAVSSPAASPDNSSPAASVAAAAPPPQPVFKILPRASRGTSSASSSADVDDDGSSSFSTSTRSKLRRDLTLEEREAAYKEARERIFNRPDPVEQRTTPPAAPPSTSAASSNAGEDAASIQSSLGNGITRPSSAGSTFSRSSAALSVSGQRPPPSIASDSNSSMRSGYFGYYQQQPGSIPPPPPAPPASSGGIPYPMPNLRQAAPSFDPATGGWTYHPTTTPMMNEFAQTPSSYSAMMSPYGGMQSPPAPPMMMPPYQPPMPGATAPTLQFDASTGAAMTPSASWHRNLPSPALSGSSGNSYPPSQQQQPPSGPSSASASANSDTGYLMRFPEGAIVTAGGGVVGPPQPYAAVAVEAGLRSASSLSLGASSSASRVATRGGGTSSGPNSLRRLSQSTTQSLGSGSVHSSSAPLSDDAASLSRRSPSATSGAADDSPEASLAGENLSEVGSSAGGGSGSGPSSLAGGGGGGSSDGKRHGRKATIVGRRGRPDRPREGEDGGGGEESSREPSPLHPSLPAKPSWAATAAASPSAQTGPSATSAGSSASPPVSSGDHQVGSLSSAPPPLASARGGSSLASLTSSSWSSSSALPQRNGGAPGFPPLSRPIGAPNQLPPPPPVQGAWTRPSGAYVGSPAGPPPSAPNGYTQYASAATQAPAPHLLQHPHPHHQQQQLQQPPQQQQHHLQPSSYSAWLSQAAVGPPPVQVNYQPGPGGARHPTQAPPSSYAPPPPPPPPAGPPADLMTMPDMRRPPPRSTQLFDPNKPTNSGAMRRVASGAGSTRRM